eukprot:jgi/Ulvmu1/7886/UM004_0117.1
MHTAYVRARSHQHCVFASVYDRRQHRNVRSFAAPSSSEAWESPVFGMPMAPSKIWEGFQKESREHLVAELTDPAGGDMLLAALHVAAEDDAASSKSTVPLPTQAFVKRVDSMVQQLGYHIDAVQPDLDDQQQAVDFIVNFFFSKLGYRVAAKPLELYSQYRIYMNRVLAQRCGTPEALAIVLGGFLRRAADAGHIKRVDIELGIPEPGQQPVVRVAGSNNHADANVKWLSPRESLLACLELLKRCYWSWDWEVDAPESFVIPARSFLGDFGRAGVGAGVVGVMQPTGRPYGDLRMALLATERLSQVQGGFSGGPSVARHIRDMGVLLCHLQRYNDAKVALGQYHDWIHEASPADLDATLKNLEQVNGGGGVAISKEEAELVDQLLQKATQLSLENTYDSS